ncbi:MAG: glycosyltransferase [Bacteroidales bacterium]|nr:glycosyltransferase [Bacteroidales bacterium]
MDFFYQFDGISQIVIAVFLSAGLIQLVYYLFIYNRPVCRKEQKIPYPAVFPPVSVIVCAHNEQEQLEENLHLMLTQDYPQYEVIVVNDCSVDDTEELLNRLKAQYSHLRSTIIRKNTSFRNSKKFASIIGIKAARYEWMLFTDANCKPASKRWIRSMSRFFTDNKSIVLGYSGYIPQKGFKNKWLQYASCFDAMRYLGFAMCRMPYTGIRRNLAYRRSLFFQHNGFAEHTHIFSGDYDLLISQAATHRNAAVNFASEAHICTTAHDWIRQKCGYYTITQYFKSYQHFLLWLEPFSLLVFLGAFISLCWLHPAYWMYFSSVLLLRYILFLTVFGLSMKRLKITGILPYSIFFDLAMPIVNAYVYLLNKTLAKHNRWN